MTSESKAPNIAGQPELDILDEAGIGFNPTDQTVDLSKEEKRRTTALLMAIQAYSHLIIKDAEMYAEIRRARRDDAVPGEKPQVIQPATIDGMVDAALKFDRFICGESVAVATDKNQSEGTSQVNQD